jgi:hypothetical protein
MYYIFLTLALVGGDWYPLGRMLGGPQNRYGRHGEEKILAPTGIHLHSLSCSVRRHSVYRLRYPGSQEAYQEGT